MIIPDEKDYDVRFWLGFEFEGPRASKAAAFFAAEGYETRANPDGTFLAVANPALVGILEMCGLLFLALEGLDDVSHGAEDTLTSAAGTKTVVMRAVRTGVVSSARLAPAQNVSTWVSAPSWLPSGLSSFGLGCDAFVRGILFISSRPVPRRHPDRK